MKPKITFVVQRYGEKINGGAEFHCKLLVQHLKNDYEIEVLTSCALNYIDWHDHFPPGETFIDGVKVHRFPTGNRKSNRLLWVVRKQNRFRKILILLLKTLRIDKSEYGKNVVKRIREKISNEHIKAQGPYLPDLINYIKENNKDYKAIIFFTYLYYPTVRGINIAPQKSILIPTAHDEPDIRKPYFENVFNLPKTIIYNTEIEKQFVNDLFGNNHVHSTIAGVGIDINENEPFKDIPAHYNFSGNYILYLGRVDTNKGCKILIDYFLKFKEENKSDLKLLMLGGHFMPIKKHPDIIYPGFADETIKVNAIKQSLSLIVPSFYESLSIVSLEAMYLEVPIIVNGECEVLKKHIIDSDGGFYYTNYIEFETALKTLVENPELRKVKGSSGKQYVDKNYNWDVILHKIKTEIDKLS